MRNRLQWVAFAMLLCSGGCGPDIQQIADQHVRDDMLARHDKKNAIEFLEQDGQFYDTEEDEEAEEQPEKSVDREIVLPLLRRLRELAPTEQWAMIRPEKTDSAYGILVELPNDSATVDRMADAVQEADDNFSGFILQQWGHEWLLIDLIDKKTYEFLKKNNPDIDKQR